MSLDKLIVFDFDGTLTTIDTIFPLAKFYARNGARLRFTLFLVIAIAYKFKLISNESLKRCFVYLFFKDRSLKSTSYLNKNFFKTVIYNKNIFHTFQKYQKLNEHVVILSANFKPLIDDWLVLHNMNGVSVLATELDEVDGVFSGKLVGSVCRGQNKVKRLASFIENGLGGNRHEYTIIAYADEASDQPVMSYADRAIWVET